MRLAKKNEVANAEFDSYLNKLKEICSGHMPLPTHTSVHLTQSQPQITQSHEQNRTHSLSFSSFTQHYFGLRNEDN